MRSYGSETLTPDASAREDGLDRQSINALRLATNVYVLMADGRHFLRTVKQPTFAERERDPFARDVYFDIEVEGRIENYERDGSPMSSGFASVWASRGIWAVVRPGDKVTLLWVRGNHSEVTRESGLAVDEVYAVVTRGEGAKRKEMRFMLGAHTGLRNSARMCRSDAESGT